MFGTKKLDEIAENLHRNGTGSRRFLFSVKDEENTPEQLIIRDIALNRGFKPASVGENIGRDN